MGDPRDIIYLEYIDFVYHVLLWLMVEFSFKIIKKLVQELTATLCGLENIYQINGLYIIYQFSIGRNICWRNMTISFYTLIGAWKIPVAQGLGCWNFSDLKLKIFFLKVEGKCCHSVLQSNDIPI